jgi:ABC-2 type transport system permease protein
MFALPLVLAGIFALAFGSGSAEGISIRVLLFNEDQGLLSRLIEGAAGSSEADERLELVPVGREGYERIEDGEASALVHIPAGFTDDFLKGEPITLELVKNPAHQFLPQVVEEGMSIGAVVLSQASRVLGPELEQISGLVDSQDNPSDLQISALSVGINRKMNQLERYLFPPIIDFESVTLKAEDKEESPDVSILSYFLPGLSILGILFLAQGATRDILRERESGLLRHLLTAPVSVGDYLFGKCLSVFLVTSLGFGVLVAVGVAAGASWGSPPAVVALLLASSLASSGTLLLIMSLVRTERQGDAITTTVVIVWSILGGTFFPVSQFPSFLVPVAKSTLTYWANDGFLQLIVNQKSLADIVVNLAVLVVAGALFLVAGAWFLRRKIVAGVV